MYKRQKCTITAIGCCIPQQSVIQRGIDHALLVVACDDGVMAQTREHLAILQLTGNPMLTVALDVYKRQTLS